MSISIIDNFRLDLSYNEGVKNRFNISEINTYKI